MVNSNRPSGDPEQLLSTIDNITGLLRTGPRAFILYSLLIYKELSLSELSKKLNKPKSSLHHHIKQLVDGKVIKKARREGQKDVYYSVDLAPLKEISYIDSDEMLSKLAPDKLLDAVRSIHSFSKVLFPLVYDSVSLFEIYLDERQKEYEERGVDIDQLKEQDNFSFSLGFMCEEDFPSYKDDLEAFMKQRWERREQEKKDAGEELDRATPYLICNMALPMHELLKYRKIMVKKKKASRKKSFRLEITLDK
ncbi:MAG: winged helix-turn-helix domain-containing protein [Candidatus Odinarchaeota archaeon]